MLISVNLWYICTMYHLCQHICIFVKDGDEIEFISEPDLSVNLIPKVESAFEKFVHGT